MKQTVFNDMRKMAFNTKPEDIGVKLTNNKQVYAGIIDMNINNTIATLVMFFDGTVSLYYSNDRADIGLGQNPIIKKNAMTFLVNTGQCLENMVKVEAFEVLNDKDIHVYLKTSAGVYSSTIHTDSPNTKVNGFLNLLLQKVLSAIRTEGKSL